MAGEEGTNENSKDQSKSKEMDVKILVDTEAKMEKRENMHTGEMELKEKPVQRGRGMND